MDKTLKEKIDAWTDTDEHTEIPFRKRDEVSKAVNSWFAKLEKEPTHPGLS